MNQSYEQLLKNVSGKLLPDQPDGRPLHQERQPGLPRDPHIAQQQTRRHTHHCQVDGEEDLIIIDILYVKH